jgi:MtfA peptidase
MFLRWLQRHHRRKILAQPFPADWHAYLDRNVRFFRQLDEREQNKLRDDLRVLVAEKHWEGCLGFQITDEVKVTIAAQAALLLLEWKEQFFNNVQSILVYPTAYVAPDTTVMPGGIVVEGKSAREGEAWYRGPVILSWDDVVRGGRREHDGHNVVFHEFAHQLDMQNGRTTDGIPPLDSKAAYVQWRRVLHSEYERLVDDCEHGQQTLLDCYGAVNVAEFFAVATECFFERPQPVRRRHPALYEILANYYRQDPSRRRVASPS